MTSIFTTSSSRVESATVSDSATSIATFVSSKTEAATTSESISLTQVLNLSLTETTTASDSTTQNVQFGNVGITETVTSQEAFGHTANFQSSRSETTSAFDDANSYASMVASRIESAVTSDANELLTTFNATITESDVVGDINEIHVGQFYYEDITETVSASESFATTATYSVALNDLCSLNDTFYSEFSVVGKTYRTETLIIAAKNNSHIVPVKTKRIGAAESVSAGVRNFKETITTPKDFADKFNREFKFTAPPRDYTVIT
jgi:hypothetical protein